MEETTQPQHHVSGLLADVPYESENPVFFYFYRTLSHLVYGETLAERTQRILREEERQRRIRLTDAQDLSKLR